MVPKVMLGESPKVYFEDLEICVLQSRLHKGGLYRGDYYFRA